MFDYILHSEKTWSHFQGPPFFTSFQLCQVSKLSKSLFSGSYKENSIPPGFKANCVPGLKKLQGGWSLGRGSREFLCDIITRCPQLWFLGWLGYKLHFVSWGLGSADCDLVGCHSGWWWGLCPTSEKPSVALSAPCPWCCFFINGKCVSWHLQEYLVVSVYHSITVTSGMVRRTLSILYIYVN